MEAEVFSNSTHQTCKDHRNLLHLAQGVAVDSELSDEMADLKTKLSAIELAAPKDNTAMHAPSPSSQIPPSPKRKSSADHYLTSPKRRSVEEIMRSQPKSRKAPASSIDAACKQMKKFEYPTQYRVTTSKPNAFLDLPHEIHENIFRYLAGNRVFEIVAHAKRNNAIKAMRQVNKQMFAVTRGWMRSAMKEHIKIQPFEYQLHPPMLQPFRYQISHDVGIFDSQTTIWSIDAAPMDKPNEYDLLVESHCARARMVSFTNGVHLASVRHLKFRVRTMEDLMNYFTYLPSFPSLKSVEITVLSSRTSRMVDDPNLFGYSIWNAFWKNTSWCHPGNCCNCCAPPEILIRGDDDTLSTEAQTIPVALLPLLPEDPKEREALVDRRTRLWYYREPDVIS